MVAATAPGSDADEIARFIAERGVTRCPTAYAVECTGEITDEERAVHTARGVDPLGDAFREKYRRAIQAGLPRGWATRYANGTASRFVVDKIEGRRGRPKPPEQPTAPAPAVLPVPKQRKPRHGGGKKRIDFTPEMDRRLIELRTAGNPFQGVIDKEFQITHMTLRRRALELGLDVSTRYGSSHKGSKLNTAAGAPQTAEGTASPRPDANAATDATPPVNAPLVRRGRRGGAPKPVAPTETPKQAPKRKQRDDDVVEWWKPGWRERLVQEAS